MGAIYLDGGLEKAEKFVTILYQHPNDEKKDYKSSLQTVLNRLGCNPLYR
jgi:dsRNA-specific ribonuclease